MIRKMIPVFTAAAISMSISFVVPVVTITAFQFFAASESFGETKDKEDVENDGWTCQVYDGAFILCTKKGEKDWICDRYKPQKCVELPRSGQHGGVLIPTRPGGDQLAPTKDKPRFPTKVWKFQKAPVTNAPTTDKPKKTRPSSTGTIMNTVPMKLYKTVPMKQKQN